MMWASVAFVNKHWKIYSIDSAKVTNDSHMPIVLHVVPTDSTMGLSIGSVRVLYNT